MASVLTILSGIEGHTAASGIILQGRRLFMLRLYIFPGIIFMRYSPVSSHSERHGISVPHLDLRPAERPARRAYTQVANTTT